jgi:sulfatase modifying factor 1
MNTIRSYRYLAAGLAIVGCALIAYSQTPAGSKRTNPTDGLTYAWIPAGSFQMRCDTCLPNERPAHKVTLTRGFWIGATEVTTGAYKRYAQNTHLEMPPETVSDWTINPGWRNDQLPIANVTWTEASNFCKWAGGALPSEAQWEYAARGGSSQDPYGPLDEIAWTANNSGNAHIDSESLFNSDKPSYEEKMKENGNRPHEVGQKRPNGFGLYDMIGNVSELTNDWGDAAYYANSPEMDPPGPATGQTKISRGGYFAYHQSPNRASKRLGGAPSERSPFVGLRCVLPEIH